MSRRLLLRRQLHAAWRRTIEGPYARAELNSERGLQVFFCHHLLEEFHAAGVERRLFIEPRILGEAPASARQPDIVIANRRHVIGVVELKYVPRGRPSVAKDLRTLAWCVENRDAIRIRNERFLGLRRSERPYTLSPDPVLCWAGVHRERGLALVARAAVAVRPHFLELHAVTSDGGSAETASNFAPRRSRMGAGDEERESNRSAASRHAHGNDERE
jgi:hypothetical protein